MVLRSDIGYLSAVKIIFRSHRPAGFANDNYRDLRSHFTETGTISDTARKRKFIITSQLASDAVGSLIHP